MSSALTSAMSGAVSFATSFVGDFAPVLYTIGGIALGMWVLVFARDYFRW